MAINRNTTSPNAIFVDDGGPDAFEFATNYIRFDARDPNDRARAWDEASRLWAVRQARHSQLSPDSSLRPPELSNLVTG